MKIIFIEDMSAFNPMFDYMLADLYKKYSFEILIESVKKSRITDIIKGEKGQKLGFDKINFLFTNQYKLKNILETTAETTIVLFFNSSFIYALTPYTYLRECKKQKNVYFILYYIDIVEAPQSKHANFLTRKGIFDQIYTFDSRDAVKYNYKWWPTPYSAVDNLKIIKSSCDIYFCGATKTRVTKIIDILDMCQNYHINVHMDVLPKEEDRVKFDKFNRYPNMLTLHDKRDIVPYEQIIKNSLQAKCILDIVADGQTGLSLKPYEAVVYNRKLLTNNKNILNFQYYDSRYIRYFKSVDDIDWKWVTTDMPVEYNYKGDFSPVRLIEDFIKNYFNEKRKL